MKTVDFGQIDGAVVLFGGPYSNLQALTALRELVGETVAICTGDLVGYCAEPNETVALFFQSGFRTIAGNCERQLVAGEADCGCGFDENTVCDVLSAGWWPWLLNTAHRETVSLLRDLPDLASFTQNGRRYAVIHGGATMISRFLWPSSCETEFMSEIDAIERWIGPVDGIIAGHCGIAFQRMIGHHQWINTGAIGLPPHDGRPESRYVVLTDGQPLFQRLRYDHEVASGKMKSAGLVQGYHETLKNGIWPSEEILPRGLRRSI
jgi:predicted phosphodiesterase